MNFEMFSETNEVGKVFLTTNGNILFLCTLCKSKYKKYEEYFDHVMEKHLLLNLLNDNNDNLHGFTEVQTNKENTETDGINFELTNIFEVEDAEFLAPPTNFGDIEKVNAVWQHTNNSFEIKTTDMTQNVSSNEEKKRIYKCPICDFTTNTYNNISSHTQRHTGKKKHCCKECGKRFYTSSELRVHSRIHSGERPFLCTSCGQTFVTSASLWRHNKICLDKSNKTCTVCDMVFKDATLLQNHLTKHKLDERPHKCSLCRAQFKLPKGLREHMETHERGKQFKCQFCSETFNQQINLSAHLKSTHSRTTSLTISVKKS